MDQLRKHTWLLNGLLLGLFLLSLRYLSYTVGYQVTIVIFIVQLLKVAFVDEELFDKQGIVSFTLLLLYAFRLFVSASGMGHVPRLSWGGWALMAVWMGFFHFRTVIKPFTYALSMKQPQKVGNEEFILKEEETHLFVPRESIKEEEQTLDDLFNQLP